MERKAENEDFEEFEEPEQPKEVKPKIVPVPTKSILNVAISKMKDIEKELNTYFVEREDLIKDLLRAMISKQHVLLLGPPGTGKSELASAVLSHVSGGSFFSWLLNKTSDPAEILGPFSFKSMEQDRFTRKPTGLLPEAHVAFLDEIFKCNSATLNALLSILNERIFYNDGVKTPVPLCTMIAASNEGPEDDSLAALYDRLAFRHHVGFIKEPGNVQTVWENDLAKRNPSLLGPRTHTVITMEELKALQEKVSQVKVSTNALRALSKLKQQLQLKDIVCSDRRWVIALQVLQASAVLGGRDEVKATDFQALKSILWEREADIKVVEELVGDMVDPYESEMKKLVVKAEQIKAGVMGITDKLQRTAQAIEAKVSLDELRDKASEMLDEAEDAGGDIVPLEGLFEKIENLLKEVVEDSLLGPGRSSRTKKKKIEAQELVF